MLQKVYLAGGFRTDWGQEVEDKCNPVFNNPVDKFEFINPKKKEFKDGIRTVMEVTEYGQWDLHMIRKSDIVLVYVERDNTGCIGLSVEAGYAKGLGKTVILVLEPHHETIPDRYLQFIEQVADITFDNLESATEYLKSFGI